jgi:ATP-dependent DNA helicase RecG
VQKATRQALERLKPVPEWQDAAWLKERGWPDFIEALQRLHRPKDAADVAPGAAPWQRLAYDELLAGQLALALVRQSFKDRPGRSVNGDGRVRAAIADALPFALTGSQREAVRDIEADMSAPRRMLRLLQGDVGSGKTVVALLSMAIAVEGGAQAAMMAPTEVLARQHLETIAPLAEKAGLRVGQLTGREKGKIRQELLDRLAAGYIDIMIGTHALFQADVVF